MELISQNSNFCLIMKNFQQILKHNKVHQHYNCVGDLQIQAHVDCLAKHYENFIADSLFSFRPSE